MPSTRLKNDEHSPPKTTMVRRHQHSNAPAMKGDTIFPSLPRIWYRRYTSNECLSRNTNLCRDCSKRLEPEHDTHTHRQLFTHDSCVKICSMEIMCHYTDCIFRLNHRWSPSNFSLVSITHLNIILHKLVTEVGLKNLPSEFYRKWVKLFQFEILISITSRGIGWITIQQIFILANRNTKFYTTHTCKKSTLTNIELKLDVQLVKFYRRLEHIHTLNHQTTEFGSERKF